MTLGRLKGMETGLQKDTCTLKFTALHTLHTHTTHTSHTHYTHTHTHSAVLFSREKEGNSAICGKWTELEKILCQVK